MRMRVGRKRKLVVLVEVVCLFDVVVCEGKVGVEFSIRRLGNRCSWGGVWLKEVIGGGIKGVVLCNNDRIVDIRRSRMIKVNS